MPRQWQHPYICSLMAVFHSTDHLPQFKNPVLTIGTFDGVHKGHQAILQDVARHAAGIGGESIVITFDPHPRKLIYPNQSMHLLTSLDRKIALIQKTGIDHIVVVPFTHAFAALTAEAYISEFLVKKFHPHTIVIGYDHRFGNDRTGDIALLKSFGDQYHFTVHEIPVQTIDEAAVSSTKIRKAIDAGDVHTAATMLGRPYQFSGTVEQGAQIGRQLGYPTANIRPLEPDQLIPANGVYAITASYEDHVYKGMLNIGIRPTVTESAKLHIEAHLFGFSQDIYGKELTIIFHERLRDEQKFPSLEALKEQLAKDAVQAQSLLASL